MKNILFLFISLVSVVCMRAESVFVDGLKFEVLSESELTAQVVGNELTSDTLIDLVIPNKVTINGVGYEVRKIDYPAFKGCSHIKSVSFPPCLQEIEIYAFSGCENLRKVTFTDCDSLILDYCCFDRCNVETIILSGNVDCDYDPDQPFWQLGASQIVIDGDIPRFNGINFNKGTIIINDNVSNLEGVHSLFPSDLYCLGKMPPKLGHLEAYTPNVLQRTFVHVPPEAYAAYFQAPEWSSYYYLNNDAIETTELSFSTHDKQLKVGEKFLLSVNKDGSLPVNIFTSLKWYSNPCVTIVVKSDGDWELTGLQPGEMTIVAACGELEDTCHISVIESTPIVTLSKSEVLLRSNRIATINYNVENSVSQDVEISIDNPDVAVARLIGGKIEILGVSTGVATLTVTTKEGECIAGECTIIVYDPDFNGDDNVDVSDLNIIINTLLGKTGLTAICDVNGDGIVDISDVNIIINEILGKMDFDIPTGNQGGNTAPPHKQ